VNPLKFLSGLVYALALIPMLLWALVTWPLYALFGWLFPED
jgi:hypothetical protein